MFGRVLALLALAALCIGLPAGCSGGVVGGECRKGYDQCGSHCFDFQTDVDHCGSCDNACPAQQTCVEGVCRRSGSGGAGGTDGGVGGSGGSSGSGGTAGDGGESGAGDGGDGSTDGPSGDGSNGSGGRNGSGGGNGTGGRPTGPYKDGGDPNIGPDGAICIGPYNTPQNCGRCGLVCPPDKPLCQYNESYTCVERCTDPLTDCGGRCVNTQTDEFNCGRCGNRCPSGICQGGMCVGATAGHEILMCSDFRQRPVSGSATERLLGNAVFIGTTPMVRILAYTEFAPTKIVDSVKATLDAVKAQRGRDYVMTEVVTSTDAVNMLDVTDYEAFIVFDQQVAPPGRMLEVGDALSTHLDPFVRAGGVVIVFAGPTGRGEMPNFLSAANLLNTSAQTILTGEQIYNRSLGDAVGLNVVTPFRALGETCSFETDPPDPAATFVITDRPASDGVLGNPVVVHRVISPPDQ